MLSTHIRHVLQDTIPRGKQQTSCWEPWRSKRQK